MTGPRVYELPSGTHTIEGITFTVCWEDDPNVTERRIYFNGAQKPSIVIRRPGLLRLES